MRARHRLGDAHGSGRFYVRLDRGQWWRVNDLDPDRIWVDSAGFPHYRSGTNYSHLLTGLTPEQYEKSSEGATS